MRALILVLDSVGIGHAPDAAAYGDAGADTMGHIARYCTEKRDRPLALPNLATLGLAHVCRLAGNQSAALKADRPVPLGRYASACERSKGKDTPSGHWELAGVPVAFDWTVFPRIRPCFPPELIDALCRRAGLPGILGDRHASGTEIIAELGEEHMRSGKPICYTSADSVFQIAAHEETFGLERLYDVCSIAHTLVAPMNVGRVIARPFVGASPSEFRRTANRRDYSVPPPAPTLLDCATAEGRDVVTVGKIGDIFAHSGTGRVLKGDGNMALFDRTLQGFGTLADGGLLFANFIDFDSVYGHRRDAAGYAAALEAFDACLPELFRQMRGDDLVVITADHGCDPTWSGTDHTREQVPLLMYGERIVPGSAGVRTSFADVGASVAAYLDLPALNAGAAIEL
jgi:phosphopentomutase